MTIKQQLSIITVLFLSFITKAQWTVLPLNTGYQNHSLSFINKDTGYVCNGVWQGPPPGINHTKLFKTTNGGNTWITAVDDYTNTPICQMTYLTENFGIYRHWQDNALKTTDGGITSTPILISQGSSAGKLLQVIDSSMYAYGYNNTVLHTINGGSSWSSKSTLAYQSFFNGGSYVQLQNIKNGFVFGEVSFNTPSFHTEYAVYKTTDSCQTLQLSYYSSKPNCQYRGIKFINATTAIMLYDNVVLRTQNLGTTWDTVHTYSSGNMGLSLDSKNNFTIISGSDGTLLTSVNGGLTFQSINSGFSPGVTSICIADANLKVVYGIYNTYILKLQLSTTGLPELGKTGFSVYPNPATNAVHISSNNFENISVDIYNYSGVLVKSATINSSQKSTPLSVDISDLTNGYYIFRINSKTKTEYCKILKQ